MLADGNVGAEHAVKQWRDIGGDQGAAYILWECPSRRVPENDCYYYSYRAETLGPALSSGEPIRSRDAELGCAVRFPHGCTAKTLAALATWITRPLFHPKQTYVVRAECVPVKTGIQAGFPLSRE